MPTTATILCIVFLALSIGWRGFVQYRRNGDFGFRRPPSDAGALEKVARLLVLGGVAGLLLSPVLALAGLTSPLPDLDSVPIRSLGLVLACSGIALHVRGVEEPHLMRKHHESYSTYAGRTGRFLPGIGRM